jgi:hypothetical protein
VGMITLVCLGVGSAIAAGSVEPGFHFGNGILFGGLLVVVGVVCLAFHLVHLIADLRLPRRATASGPERALLGWLRALAQARGGYLIACLSPPAREQDLVAPRLPPLRTATSVHPTGFAAGLANWARTFAATGTGQIRWFDIRRMRLVAEDGDVAEVVADLTLRSLPRWTNLVALVIFLVFHLIGLVVALTLFLVLRRSRQVTISKTLIRGRDGLWYLVDAALTDGTADGG